MGAMLSYFDMTELFWGFESRKTQTTWGHEFQVTLNCKAVKGEQHQ